ncbi:transporter substrate-binding domain-containing protein [Alteromonas sp. 1_MG-2023]|uniref:substrate-binding periplasmic protein n=1 Tax=Alteromonas sp. 1_MG-2023 TaxID=3062669 RepID=UPI0026E45065|nr:transporter substrate-binding domain-containing protein [Alteromonas sp. 1_MG-2023]MDO6566413.1 transporter substrate-binding domain-containing protein [Alteromonas sp. 1_MG-2023]
MKIAIQFILNICMCIAVASLAGAGFSSTAQASLAPDLPKSELSEADIYNFGVNSPGSYPYLYLNEKNSDYSGIVVRIFEHLQKQSGINADYIDSNSARTEAFVRSGDFDLFLTTPLWLQKPEKLIFTDPVVSHQTFLYSATPFDANALLQDLIPAKICTREGFVYSGLTEYFERGDFVRIEASSQKLMASMLVANRCDYAVLNNYNAWQVFSQPEVCEQKSYQSPQPTSTVNLVFGMRPALESLRQRINSFLAESKRSGVLDSIIENYTRHITFPASTLCSD